MSVPVAVVGSGYVGTVRATCLAHVGDDVVGLEIDEAKCKQFWRSTAPLFEPGLQRGVAVIDGVGVYLYRLVAELGELMETSAP